MNKLTADQTKILNEQIRVSMVQGILQAIGPEHVVKLTSISLTNNALEPIGTQLIAHLTIEIYPKAS